MKIIFFPFKCLEGKEALEAFNNGSETRGYFETEDAWIAFNHTEGIADEKEFVCQWQAKAYASTDLSFEDIWKMTEYKFNSHYLKMVAEQISKLFKKNCT